MTDWEINKHYIIGDIVCHNNLYFVCMREHTSLIPPGNDLLSTIFNFEWIEIERPFLDYIYSNKNLLYNPAPIKYRGLMLPGIYYNIGDIVTQDGQLFICTKETVPILDTTLNGHPNFIKLDRKVLDDITGSSFDTKSEPGGNGSVTKKPSLFQNSGTMTPFQFDFFNVSTEPTVKNTMDLELKRKLDEIEDEIIEYNKKRRTEGYDIREKILLLNVDIPTKAFILKKYDEQISRAHSSDRSKGMQWLNTICDIPFGNYIPFPVKRTDSSRKLTNFFKKIETTLDEAVYGQKEVKREILEYVAKIVSNRDGKGQVLALQGPPGVGKTKLIKSGLSKALGLPFAQINFGGMNDANVLIGHDQTYVGSKPGKIVDIITKAGCMNPVIYIDEIDKIAEGKSKEIFGVLTHLLDPEQNAEFSDHYIGETKLDLSKAFFVIAFNDISQVDHIVSDRMKILHIKSPSIEEKVEICQRVILKELCEDSGIIYNKGSTNENPKKRSLHLYFPNDIIEYIILQKTVKEEGVRKLRRNLETVIARLNIDFLLRKGEYPIENYECIVSKEIIDQILDHTNDLSDYIASSMYL